MRGSALGVTAWFGARVVLALGLLAGCTAPPAPQAAAPAARPATVPADPLVAFAAAPPQSGSGVVTAPDTGRSTPVRLARAYIAASGRECREVLVGSGAEERSQLFCQADGGWVAARPLLRGGGGPRP